MEKAKNREKSDGWRKTQGPTGQNKRADNQQRNADHKFFDRKTNSEAHQQAAQ